MEIDRIVVAAGCGLALLAFFGVRSLVAAILAAVLAWIYTNIALVIAMAGFLLSLWKLGRQHPLIPRRATESINEAEIIDCEFEKVVEK